MRPTGIVKFPERRSGPACGRTTIDYVTSNVCGQKCDGPTNALGGSVLILKNYERSVVWQRLLTRRPCR